MKQELEIIIGSEVKEGLRGINSAEQALGKLNKSASGSLAKSLENIERLLQQISKTSYTTSLALTSNFQRIPKAVGGATEALGGLSKGAKNSGSAIYAFNNIIRDAPYGINGVTNNITQLSDVLIGSAGIGIAISLVTTALVSLTQKYGSLGNAVDALLYPLNEQQRIQKLVNDTLVQGQKDAQGEIVELDKLYKATQNVNVPLAERNKIVDELQKQYPSYFNNLTNEQVLAGQAASAYEKLRQALIGAATARAIDKQLEEIGGRQVELLIQERKIRENLTKAAIAQSNAEKALNDRLKDGVRSKGAVEAQDRLTASVVRTASAVNSVKDELKENIAAQSENIAAQRQLFDIQQGLIAQYGSIAAGVKDTTEKVKELKFESLDLGKAIRGQQLLVNYEQKVTAALPIEIQIDPANIAAQQQKLLDGLRTVVTDPIGIAKIEAAQAMESLNEFLSKALQDLALSGIVSVGDIIGSALVGSGNGIKAAMTGFLNLLGNFFQQVGLQLITYSKVLTGLQVAIKSLNPYVAAIAGGLAIIAGGALKAYASSLPSFATGGGVIGRPTLAMIGDNPGREEYVIPSEVLDKMGGAGGDFIAETRISGTDLLLLVKRAGLNSNRANG